MDLSTAISRTENWSRELLTDSHYGAARTERSAGYDHFVLSVGGVGGTDAALYPCCIYLGKYESSKNKNKKKSWVDPDMKTQEPGPAENGSQERRTHKRSNAKRALALL